MNFSTAFSRLRLIGFIEGISFVILAGVAMPLKYLADYPDAVTVVGSLHGFLWILFMLAVVDVWRRYPWGLFAAAWASLASLLPIGTFLMDRFWKRDQQRFENHASASPPK